MNKDSASATLQNLKHIIVGNLSFTLHDNLVTFDRYHFTGILIDKVLVPTLQHTSGKLTAHNGFQGFLVDLYLLSEVENTENILISFKTNSAQQCRYRQFLLTIDVSVHHVVDVGGELNPRTLERDDTGRVKQRSVSMYVLTEEYAGRTVQLRNDNTLSTVNNERTVGRHIRDGAKEHVLNHRAEILVIWVCAIQFQLSLQRYAIGEATLQTLINGVTGRVNIVIQELKNKVVSRVCDREVLSEHLIQTVVLAFLRRSV